MRADAFASITSVRAIDQRSESAIQRLLAETGVGGLREGDAVSVDAQGIEAAADWDNLKSPETYVGYDRAQNFASRGGAELDRRRVYAVPARLALNQWALAGEWTMGRQATVLGSPKGRIVHRFRARDLHLVMGAPGGESPYVFACRSTGSRRVLLTAWTLTKAATARLWSTGCIS